MSSAKFRTLSSGLKKLRYLQHLVKINDARYKNAATSMALFLHPVEFIYAT